MIKKIISIKSVGVFNNNFRAVDLKKFNIIYGENGRGKSTLAVILRSLCSGDPTFILERKTVDSNSLPEIQLLIEPSIHTVFKDGNWNNRCLDLEIFDSHFISNNIYSGNSVEIEHKRNLHQFVIGEDGVKYANLISRYDNFLKSINNLISTNEGQIKQNIVGSSIDIPTFIGLDCRAITSQSIDEKIALQEKAIAELKKGRLISEKRVLDILLIPEIPRNHLESLLSKTIKEISKDAEKVMHNHIEKCSDKSSENWIQTGLRYIKDNDCPFCGQNILGNLLIQAYHDYFDATYIYFKNEIHEFSEEIRKILSEDRLLAIQGVLISNELLAQFWKEYISFKYEPLSFSEIQDVWNKTVFQIDENLKLKEQNPLEKIILKSDLSVNPFV